MQELKEFYSLRVPTTTLVSHEFYIVNGKLYSYDYSSQVKSEERVTRDAVFIISRYGDYVYINSKGVAKNWSRTSSTPIAISRRIPMREIAYFDYRLLLISMRGLLFLGDLLLTLDFYVWSVKVIDKNRLFIISQADELYLYDFKEKKATKLVVGQKLILKGNNQGGLVTLRNGNLLYVKRIEGDLFSVEQRDIDFAVLKQDGFTTISDDGRLFVDHKLQYVRLPFSIIEAQLNGFLLSGLVKSVANEIYFIELQLEKNDCSYDDRVYLLKSVALLAKEE